VTAAPHELRREALTMALYVAICLLAVLATVTEDADHGHVRAFALVWGTTIGLALAHWFAFTLAARLVAAAGVERDDVELAAAQLAGAAAVAVMVSVPVAVAPVTSEFDIARLVLAALIAGAGVALGRLGGSGWARSVLVGVVVLVVAATIAVVKNTLAGH